MIEHFIHTGFELAQSLEFAGRQTPRLDHSVIYQGSTLLSFFPHLLDSHRHLLTFLLASLVSAKALLGEFQGTLLCCCRANLDKLNDPTLIWRKPSDLTDNFTDHTNTLRLVALAMAGLGCKCPFGHDMTFVQTGSVSGFLCTHPECPDNPKLRSFLPIPCSPDP